MTSWSDREPPDYGIDAPDVVRNLFIAGAAGLAVGVTAMLGLWTGEFNIQLFGVKLIFQLSGPGFGVGILCTAMGIWMVWDSKIGKTQTREGLLDLIEWTGREQVLDVGCGRGLMLIGAAKRLTTGKAVGIDIWQAEDLSGNRPESAVENARREGVLDRIEVKAGDMRHIPFADATFDVVLSRAAVHNLYRSADRTQAISEIARVLKPGGRALIDDIRHHRQYTAVFHQTGCADVRNVGSLVLYVMLAIITFGSLRPAKLIVRKAS
jgi:2-polyprenyl-3-methyl-5-hydroxy-6-metoxy-1,4-benzoquinol methylase